MLLLGSLFAVTWLVLNIHNTLLYPPTKGFDAPDHIKYISYVQTFKTLPLPSQGWEMYHPPLYYILTSLIPTLKSTQFFNLILLICISVFVLIFFLQKYKDFRFAIVGVTFMLSIPVLNYSIPQISNEILSTFFLLMGLMYYYSNQNRLTRRTSVALGVIAGLSLLTKFTGVVLVASIIIDLCIKRWRNPGNAIRHILIILLTAFVLSGWVYTRNFFLYRTPFVSNIDLFHIKQVPPIRDISFFTNTSALRTRDFHNSTYYSLWGGIYFTVFHDEQSSLIPDREKDKTSPQLVNIPMRILLFAGVGFIYTLFKKRNDRILIIYSFVLLTTFILYCFRYPGSTSVKGIYLLSSLLPLTIFGLNLIRRFEFILYFAYGYLLLYWWIVFHAFWMSPSWL